MAGYASAGRCGMYVNRSDKIAIHIKVGQANSRLQPVDFIRNSLFRRDPF